MVTASWLPDSLKGVVEQFSTDLSEAGREGVRERIQRLDGELASLDQAHRRQMQLLLPVERTALPTLDEQYRATRTAIAHDLAEARSRVDLVELDEQYRRIDLAFLRQTTGFYNEWLSRSLPVPRFLTYSLEDPQFELSVAGAIPWWHRSPKVALVAARPLDALRIGVHDAIIEIVLKRLREFDWIISLDAVLRCTFSGVIPADAREKVHSARGKFDRMFIVAEAPPELRWQIVETVAPPPPPILRGDPLVIGEKKTRYGTFHWLVAAFDLTPAEHYAAAEFAYKADGGE